MSWLSEVGETLGINQGDEVEETPGVEGIEEAESRESYTSLGDFPPVEVENQMKPAAPTASQRAFEKPEQEHASHRDPQRNAAAWSHGSWVANNATTDVTGDQGDAKGTGPITKEQIYDAITFVAPSLPHAFKCLMVGQVWIEQKGQDIVNWNYAGIEGKHARATCLAWTSADIPVATYRANPQAYKEWPNATVEKQMKDDPNRQTLILRTRIARPAYGSLNEATAAYVHEIERRLHMLQESQDELQRGLAERAAAGEKEAYVEIVSNSFTIAGAKDDKGKQKSFGAYNNHGKAYTDEVSASIDAAQVELANKARTT